MKQYLLFICLVFFVGILGCSKEDDESYQQESAKVYSQDFTVPVEDWDVDSGGNRIYVYQEISFLDTRMLQSGSVSVYIKSVSSEEYQQIPFVWPGGDLVETFWYGNGGVEIERLGNGFIPDLPKGSETYRVTGVVNEYTNSF
ncbi:MAG: hypothetical protein ACOC4J_01675 [Bacteroidota bacterium]